MSYSRDKKQYNIVDKFGLPKEMVSCPSCGKVYGAHNRKVCINCEECSKCCQCGSIHIDANKFVEEYIKKD